MDSLLPATLRSLIRSLRISLLGTWLGSSLGLCSLRFNFWLLHNFFYFGRFLWLFEFVGVLRQHKFISSIFFSELHYVQRREPLSRVLELHLLLNGIVNLCGKEKYLRHQIRLLLPSQLLLLEGKLESYFAEVLVVALEEQVVGPDHHSVDAQLLEPERRQVKFQGYFGASGVSKTYNLYPGSSLLLV